MKKSNMSKLIYIVDEYMWNDRALECWDTVWLELGVCLSGLILTAFTSWIAAHDFWLFVSDILGGCTMLALVWSFFHTTVCVHYLCKRFVRVVSRYWAEV